MTCSASDRIGDRDICDESKLDDYSQQRDVSHYKPTGCPKELLKMTLTAQSQVNNTGVNTLIRHKLIAQGRFQVK